MVNKNNARDDININRNVKRKLSAPKMNYIPKKLIN